MPLNLCIPLYPSTPSMPRHILLLLPSTSLMALSLQLSFSLALMQHVADLPLLFLTFIELLEFFSYP